MKLLNNFKSLLRFLLRKGTPSFYMDKNPAYAQYRIGTCSYGYPRVLRWGTETNLTVGSYCSIADGVTILLGGEHKTDCITTCPFQDLDHSVVTVQSKGNVNIGHDVWIGVGACILSGVSIGNGAVIGAMSLVTKDVPDYAIVGGNPARVIRSRFSADVVEALNRIAWWNWTPDRIKQVLPLLLSTDVNRFISECNQTDNKEFGQKDEATR